MSIRLTEEEYSLLQQRVSGKPAPRVPTKKPHKFHARRTIVDRITFPSLLEATWYTRLKIQWKGGQITEPLLQVRFALGEYLGTMQYYVADFVFIEGGELVIADAKGLALRSYRKKKKQMRLVYGICIRELR